MALGLLCTVALALPMPMTAITWLLLSILGSCSTPMHSRAVIQRGFDAYSDQAAIRHPFNPGLLTWKQVKTGATLKCKDIGY